VLPLHKDHTLPTQPRAALTDGDGATLARLEALLGPLAGHKKPAPSMYTMQVGGAAASLARGPGPAGQPLR
jgi:hypothetical protein